MINFTIVSILHNCKKYYSYCKIYRHISKTNR